MNSASPVLCCVVISAVSGVLDEWVLQGMMTPSHILHEEVLKSEIAAAFPNLLALDADVKDAPEAEEADANDDDVDEEDALAA